MITVDGEAGLYHADTDYTGAYDDTNGQFQPAFGLDAPQSLSLSESDVAVIAALKLSMDQDFGAFKVGGFVRGEFISHAPQMSYSSRDAVFVGGAGNPPTSIIHDEAWSLSVGGRVTVPLGQ